MSESAESPFPKRLVLCFDGTSNKFTGNDIDTNIVKIYEMLNRTTSSQYHYYQPGIGTYIDNKISNSLAGNMLTSVSTSIKETIDQMFGTTFAQHLVAGYRFLMKFYAPGDKIYIFGFSRGAYTARVLAGMINKIGLLSRGNEEMVQFAWYKFSEFQRSQEAGDSQEFKDMEKFKETFCREEVTVYFLGLFDCVNSVAQFEVPLFKKRMRWAPLPPAMHIRHAVSINERRVKFKPALFLRDPRRQDDAHIKEVWFAGNHGDIGGGWPSDSNNFQLSDMALKWMVEELQALPEKDNILQWQDLKVDEMKQRVEQMESAFNPNKAVGKDRKPDRNPLRRLLHDPLRFSGGLSRRETLSWWVLEVLPLTRNELVHHQWVTRRWPNRGSRRVIPHEAIIHPSVESLQNSGILLRSEIVQENVS